MVHFSHNLSFFQTNNPYLAAALVTVGLPPAPADPVADFKGERRPESRCYNFLTGSKHCTAAELRGAWENPYAGREIDRSIERLMGHSDPLVRTEAARLAKLTELECMEMQRHGFENHARLLRRKGKKLAVVENCGKWKTVVCDREPGPKVTKRFLRK